MKRIIDIGFFNFIQNTKRKNYIISSSLFMLLLLIYFVRYGQTSSFGRDITVYSMYIFLYISLFASSYIMGIDNSSGLNKVIYTSSLSGWQIIGYRLFTTVCIGINFFAFSLILQLVFSLFTKYQLINHAFWVNCRISVILYILIPLSISSLALLVSTVTTRFSRTLIIVFAAYALLIYLNQLSEFMNGEEVPFMKALPMIIISKCISSMSISWQNFMFIMGYCIVFVVVSYGIKRKIDVV